MRIAVRGMRDAENNVRVRARAVLFGDTLCWLRGRTLGGFVDLPSVVEAEAQDGDLDLELGDGVSLTLAFGDARDAAEWAQRLGVLAEERATREEIKSRKSAKPGAKQRQKSRESKRTKRSVESGGLSWPLEETENAGVVARIQSLMAGCDQPLSPDRVFVRAGTLKKITKGVARQRFVLLFNDLILFGSEVEPRKSYQFKGLVHLNNNVALACGVDNQHEDGTPALQIINTPVKKAVVFHFATLSERDSWFNDLNAILAPPRAAQEFDIGDSVLALHPNGDMLEAVVLSAADASGAFEVEYSGLRQRARVPGVEMRLPGVAGPRNSPPGGAQRGGAQQRSGQDPGAKSKMSPAMAQKKSKNKPSRKPSYPPPPGYGGSKSTRLPPARGGRDEQRPAGKSTPLKRAGSGGIAEKLALMEARAKGTDAPSPKVGTGKKWVPPPKAQPVVSPSPKVGTGKKWVPPPKAQPAAAAPPPRQQYTPGKVKVPAALGGVFGGGGGGSARPVSHAGPSKYKQGDVVEARYEDDGEWYEAEIWDVLGGEEYAVLYTEYEETADVHVSDIRRARGAASPAPEAKFAVGQRVAAVYADDGEWYDAVVVAVLGPDSFRVEYTEYEDETAEVSGAEVKSKRVTSVALPPPSKGPAFGVGDWVEAKYEDDGEWYEAEVVDVLPGGMFRVYYTDYDEEQDTAAGDIKLIEAAEDGVEYEYYDEEDEGAEDDGYEYYDEDEDEEGHDEPGPNRFNTAEEEYYSDEADEYYSDEADAYHSEEGKSRGQPPPPPAPISHARQAAIARANAPGATIIFQKDDLVDALVDGRWMLARVVKNKRKKGYVVRVLASNKKHTVAAESVRDAPSGADASEYGEVDDGLDDEDDADGFVISAPFETQLISSGGAPLPERMTRMRQDSDAQLASSSRKPSLMPPNSPLSQSGSKRLRQGSAPLVPLPQRQGSVRLGKAGPPPAVPARLSGNGQSPSPPMPMRPSGRSGTQPGSTRSKGPPSLPSRRPSQAFGSGHASRADPLASRSPANPRVFIEYAIEGIKKPLRVEFELFANVVPQTVENFRCLCTGERKAGKGAPKKTKLNYKGSPVHRIIPKFVAQMGDMTEGTGYGGWSIYGKEFGDENFDLCHTRPGLLSMANSGPDTNNSQFFLTFRPLEHLDNKHVVFGMATAGMDTLAALEMCGSPDGTPTRSVSIAKCGMA